MRTLISILIFLVLFALMMPLQSQLIQHLDASIEESVIIDESNNFTEWIDQSGNGNDAIPSAGNPGYTDEKTFPNGLKGIDVSGSRISLQLLSAEDSDSILNQSVNPRGFCIITVVYIDSIIDTWNDLIGNSSAVRSGFFMRYSESANSVANLGSTVKVGSKEIHTANAVMLSFNYDAVSSEFTYWCSENEEKLTGTIDPADFSNDNPLTIGSMSNANRYFEGMIGEILIYDTALTSEKHDEIISGLAEKWGAYPSIEKTSETFTYTGIDGTSHDVEVHYPDSDQYPGDHPCVIFFHGGGWSNGDLAQFRDMCKYFASRGMVSITANYSMHTDETLASLPSDESQKTICVVDGKSVIRWIKQNANSLGVDTSLIVAGGASAGGHISVLSMMDTDHNNPADDLDIKTNVKAFLLFCPAFTLLDRDDTPEVNVFNHVNKPFPPSLFLVGENDGWEAASHALAEQLYDNGNQLEYWMACGESHMFYRTDNWIEQSTKKADEFLVSTGILGGKSDIEDPVSGDTLVLISFAEPIVEDTISWNENPLYKSNGMPGEPYLDSIRKVDLSNPGNREIVFEKRSGPDWLSVSGTGILSGTPEINDLGNNEFIIRASSFEGNSIDNGLVILIEEITGISGRETAKQVYIYPNPTIDVVYINNISLPKNYKVFDIMGSTAMKGTLKNGQLNIKHLEKGLYILQIEDYRLIKLIKK